VIGEAVDTLLTLGWALLAWVVVLAAAGTIVLLAAAVTGALAVRGAWRAAVGAWRWLGARTAAGPRKALEGPRSPELGSRVPVVPETAERHSEPKPRKEAA